MIKLTFKTRQTFEGLTYQKGHYEVPLKLALQLLHNFRDTCRVAGRPYGFVPDAEEGKNEQS